MTAELILLDGPLRGARLALADQSLYLGDARIEVDGEAYLLTTVAGGRGHRLVNGDTLAAAGLHFEFRHTVEPSPPALLLLSCSLLFLFRALAGAAGDAQRELLERQIQHLLSDLMPAEEAAIVLGSSETAVALEADGSALLRPLGERVGREGLAIDSAARLMAAPLYVRGRLRGILGVRLSPGAADFPACRETLAAVATLASAALEAVHEVETLRTQNAILQESVGGDSLIAGSSAAMRKLLDMVARVAPLETSVLLLGESGTGKEVIARRIHHHSPRGEQPFVAINCAAITDTLLESELFGHEKGAFTGAVVQKKGKLEAAEGGTVFLDEIGELALPLQAKLLRVLQQREFERVGGTQTLRLDVRIIAATNRDLAAEAKRGAFREDLYHRLNVVALRTPPLRERREDIAELARHFLARSSARCRRRVTSISADAARCLREYDWPGNVRELENAIERAVVLGRSEAIEEDDLPETVTALAVTHSAGSDFLDPLTAAKRDAILHAWSEAGGDYKAAARSLGVHPNSLLRMIRTLGIRDQLRP